MNNSHHLLKGWVRSPSMHTPAHVLGEKRAAWMMFPLENRCEQPVFTPGFCQHLFWSRAGIRMWCDSNDIERLEDQGIENWTNSSSHTLLVKWRLYSKLIKDIYLKAETILHQKKVTRYFLCKSNETDKKSWGSIDLVTVANKVMTTMFIMHYGDKLSHHSPFHRPKVLER